VSRHSGGFGLGRAGDVDELMLGSMAEARDA
jgi:hypothetical protein